MLRSCSARKSSSMMMKRIFFFNDTATTEIYTLSLHDALPISERGLAASLGRESQDVIRCVRKTAPDHVLALDRKSTRLNSSHGYISYAVFCLKKKQDHHRAGVNKHLNDPDEASIKRHEQCQEP